MRLDIIDGPPLSSSKIKLVAEAIECTISKRNRFKDREA